jgi:putative SOS response-associated peptidase YedK
MHLVILAEVVERTQWDRWLAGTKEQAVDLLKLAPEAVFQHGREDTAATGSLFD